QHSAEHLWQRHVQGHEGPARRSAAGDDVLVLLPGREEELRPGSNRAGAGRGEAKGRAGDRAGDRGEPYSRQKGNRGSKGEVDPVADCYFFCLAISHTRALVSSLPETRYLPSAENASASIIPVWPSSTATFSH